MTPDQLRQAHQLLDEGATLRQIARELGITPGQLEQDLQDN